MEEVTKLLAKREKAEEKSVKTKANTPTKKVKKLSKAAQQILDIESGLVIPDNYLLVNTAETFEAFIKDYKTYKSTYEDPYTYLDTETYGLNPHRDKIISISIGFDNERYYNIPLRPFKHELSTAIPTLDIEYVMDILRPLLEADTMLVLANMKYDAHILHNWTNTTIDFNCVWDTVLAGGLLNENSQKGLKTWYVNYALPDLVRRGIIKDERATPTFKFGSLFNKIPFDEVPHRLATYYACHDVFMTRAVFKFQKNIFENPDLGLDNVYKIFKEIELPLTPVLIHAERRGVPLDGDFLSNTVGKLLKEKIHELLHGKEVDGEKTSQGIYDYLGRTITLQKTKTRQKNNIKYKEAYEVVEDLNLGSPKQLCQKLYKELAILTPVMEYDKELKKKVPKEKTDKKTLNKAKKTHPVIPLILEYRGPSKLVQSFCDSLPNETIDGKVHASYNAMVKTGRMSCISEGSMVKLVGEDKPIEDVKVGDLVYCYDDNNELQISPVTRTYNNGIKDTIKLVFKSLGKHDIIELVCTPDHEIRLANGDWVEAKDLRPKDRVAHLRRSFSGERPRLYGVAGYYDQEQGAIKKKYFNAKGSDIIHHKDGDYFNNDVSNLAIMSKKAHSKLHGDMAYMQGKVTYAHLTDGRYDHLKGVKGKDNHMYLDVTKEELEEMVHTAKGCITKVPMDFDTFRKKCKEVGFDYKKVAGAYLKKYNEPTQEEFEKSFFANGGVAYKVQEDLGIGRTKFNKLVAECDICFNHELISIKTHTETSVYDLEVKDHHNFIANEICVHNCSSPNLQQVPSRFNLIRYAFQAAEGRLLASADFSLQLVG